MTDTEFPHAIEGLRATGASPSAREVVRLLDRHGREESALLARYEAFVETAPSAAARYLVALIVDEERRHHRVMGELADTIAWSYVADEGSTTIPPVPARPSEDPEFLAETGALLRHELADRRELRALRRRLRRHADVPLWELLVDMMRLDTEKHIAILAFVLHGSRRGSVGRRLRARVRWPRRSAV